MYKCACFICETNQRISTKFGIGCLLWKLSKESDVGSHQYSVVPALLILKCNIYLNELGFILLT